LPSRGGDGCGEEAAGRGRCDGGGEAGGMRASLGPEGGPS